MFLGFCWSLLGCCCRIRCCGITALVFQCLAIPIALCGIGFTAHFLNYPTQCYFSNNCGSDAYYSYSDYYGLLNTTTLYNIKVPLTRAQLAASVLMFVSCVIYIVIFAITTYRVSKIIAPFQENLSRPIDGIPVPNGYDGLLPTSSVYGTVIIENLMQPFGFAPVSPFTKQLTCENCKFSFLATYQPPQPLPSLWWDNSQHFFCMDYYWLHW